ncbi:hypothetical protein [Streptomyces sp. NBC_00690]|uniref:hypothetical protein n=1 Tax=Streptomyces sp. NBC_00690 TaxID=2975808 RepID=UPI002E2DB086|nr:hypothetical protein [Streptomyces sp. NBC_00690]
MTDRRSRAPDTPHPVRQIPGRLLHRLVRPAAWHAAGRMLWRWASGRTPGDDRKPTAQFLLGRMLLLPTVSLTVLTLAATAYFHLHGRTEQLRDRHSPALVELTHARVSLTLAQYEAGRRLGSRDGAPLPQTDLVGLGERYPSLLTEASQSLNNAAQTRALSRAQEQEIRVVSGLVVAYDDWINWANSHHDNDGLRRAGLEYASGLLGDGRGRAASTAVLDRIRTLEHELRTDTADLSGWGPLSATTASAAVLVSLLFLFLVVGTLDFIRGQLRVRSPLLTVHTVPVVLALVMVAFGIAGQHRAQHHVRDMAERLGRIAVPHGANTGIKDEIKNEIGTDARIEGEAERLSADLGNAHPQEWTLIVSVGLALGAAGALACGFTLFHYGRRHLAIHWRTL